MPNSRAKPNGASSSSSRKSLVPQRSPMKPLTPWEVRELTNNLEDVVDSAWYLIASTTTPPYKVYFEYFQWDEGFEGKRFAKYSTAGAQNACIHHGAHENERNRSCGLPKHLQFF